MTISKLSQHRETWKNKKILRKVYIQWYKSMIEDLSENNGITLELGAGSGNFKGYKPDVISSDIEKCDWLDMCFDAHEMPFEKNSISNIVMVDVLHHLANPIAFLGEAARVLETKGRLLLIEPYPSPFSWAIYKLIHPEPFIFNINYFENVVRKDKDPWDANQAVAYLTFFKYIKDFEKQLGDKLKIIKKYRMSCVLYPASGGFEHKALIPDFLIPLFEFFETILIPFRRLFAFRCYIVLEKK